MTQPTGTPPQQPQYGSGPYVPGPQQYGPGPQPGPAPYAAAGPGFGPGPAGGPPLPPAPKRGSAGKIIGIVVAAVVVLGGLATAALFLFGTTKLDTDKVESEIVRITHDAAGIDPTGVQCPDDVAVKAGATFNCSATLDGQPVNYAVSQDDDKGNVHVTTTGLVIVSKVEDFVTKQASKQAGVPITAKCGDGHKILVAGAGTPVTCTITNANDPTDSSTITGKVTDDKGTVSFE